jgi:hypothetical protein
LAATLSFHARQLEDRDRPIRRRNLGAVLQVRRLLGVESPTDAEFDARWRFPDVDHLHVTLARIVRLKYDRGYAFVETIPNTNRATYLMHNRQLLAGQPTLDEIDVGDLILCNVSTSDRLQARRVECVGHRQREPRRPSSNSEPTGPAKLAVLARYLSGGTIDVSWPAVPDAVDARVDVFRPTGSRVRRTRTDPAIPSLRIGTFAGESRPLRIVVIISAAGGDVLAQGEAHIN